MNFITRLEKLNKSFLLTMGILLISAIGIVDFLTGYELAFSVFYLLPIALITWLTSRLYGLLASLASAAAWLCADIATGHLYSHPLIPIWNSLIRFSFFVIITLLLSALRSAWQRESKLARIDHLTGAVNLRYFYELAQMEIDRAQRYSHPFTLAYIDLDNFKTVNDRFGHATGDSVLLAVTSSIRKQIRRTDIFARLGGDEFVLLLPETNEETAREALYKIGAVLLQEMQQNNWPITFSIGVLICQVAPHTTEELIKLADELMYEVKQNGKNAIRFLTHTG